ncbi:MAG: amidohydrolase family protein [Clostridia bacterium]|nr:amidohydrolase family protein [Clostridia bacterium]
MHSPEMHGFRDFPVCDMHVHSTMLHKVDRTVEIFHQLMTFHDYERIAVLAINQHQREADPGNTLKSLYCKSRLNTSDSPSRVYAYGNIFPFYDGRDTAEGYLRQVKQLYALGVDGYKMLDGKPSMRKKLGHRLDDVVFDEMYSFIEEKGMPLTMHVADPRTNWDITKMSEYAIKKGWFCDETFPTFDDLRGEVEGILTKHPQLKLCVAHFHFMGDEYDYACEFMEKFPNAVLDLTPGGEMFAGFTERHDVWREFFIKYADRLYFGSDTYNVETGATMDTLELYDGKPACSYRINQTRRMLEGSEPFDDKNYGRLVPLSLPDDALMKIYHDNFVARHGEARQVNAALAAQSAADILTALEHGLITTREANDDETEIENLKVVYNYYSNL